MKKFTVWALVLCLVAGTLAGCSRKTAADETDTASDASETIYNEQLGDFARAYETAAEEKTDISRRYALMAVAEAKLLEAAAFLPMYVDGGLYAMTEMDTNTISPVLWGNDGRRFARTVAVDSPILAEDIEEMSEQYATLKGTGTYSDWSREYLTSRGYTLTDTIGYLYKDDPVTWDILSTYLTATSDFVVNTLDALMEYDCEGELKGALATGYTVSDDGLTYTFDLRKGVKWSDYKGQEIGEVTADDFVCGLQHLMDCKGGLEYLVGSAGADIVGADDYISGTVTDFSEVGVKAVDDYTVEYTLNSDNPYFITMVNMSLLLPLNRAYYVSQGGKFGAEYDVTAEDYTYGKDYEHIAVCGAYLVSSYTPQNSIVFTANPLYYDKDSVSISRITMYYKNVDDPLYSYNKFFNGEMSYFELGDDAVQKASEEGTLEKYGYLTQTKASMYGMFTNLNRQAYANVNDTTRAVSSQSADQAKRTALCMQNVHFRRALMMSIDRASYNAQSAGEALKNAAITNTITPGNFVSLAESTTIEINGSEVTFEAGTQYGAIIQAQLDADEVALTVWDVNGNSGLGSSSGFDGWYNPEEAAAELDKAMEELSDEFTAEDPVCIDLPVEMDSTKNQNRAAVIKQSIENSLGGRVIVNLVECTDRDEWFNCGYYTSSGAECNYDIYDVSGWSPDYGDPQTYLGAFYGSSGDLVSHLGLY